MPPGIPVATVGINGALNAAVLAVRILSLSDSDVAGRYEQYCSTLADKVVKADRELNQIDEYKFMLKR